MKSEVKKIIKKVGGGLKELLIILEVENEYGARVSEYRWYVPADRIDKVLAEETEMEQEIKEATSQALEYMERDTVGVENTQISEEEIDISRLIGKRLRSKDLINYHRERILNNERIREESKLQAEMSKDEIQS